MKRNLLLCFALVLVAACGDDDVLPPDGFPIRDGAPSVPDAGRGDFEPPLFATACDPEGAPITADPTRGAWDGAHYIPGVGGRSDLAVTALAALPDEDAAVLVGGTFDAVGRVRTKNVALWTGQAWVTLGEGVEDDVTALAAAAGRVFYVAIRDSATWGGRLLRWDGTSFESVAETDGEIRTLAVAPDGRVWIGGWFSEVDGMPLPSLAVRDGSAWGAPHAEHPEGGVDAIAFHGATVCVGGSFETVGALESRSIACLEGGGWTGRPLPHPWYQVNGLLFDDAGTLYAGGNFAIEDPEELEHGGGIARWIDGAWELVGDGVHSEPAGPGDVKGLGVHDGQLYIAGRMVGAGPLSRALPLGDVARFDLDAGTWDDMRGGLGKIRGISLLGTNVLALATTRSGMIYFGGLFSLAGDRAALGVVGFDGVYWRPLAEIEEEPAAGGVTGEVLAFGTLGDCGLYVGGRFTYAGDQRVENVARLAPGRGWERLGDGLPGIVNALAVGNDPTPDVSPLSSPLRAGGFVYAGLTDDATEAFGWLAVWDGVAWARLGGGADGPVLALAVDPASWHLYAGGEFRRVGEGLAASHVARWDGERWHPLGLGLGGSPRVLYVDPADGALLAVGAFGTAGGVPVDGVARWDGAEWTPLGPSGFDGSPAAIVRHGDAIVVGGRLERADVTPLQNVAHLSAEGWRTVGNGLPGLFVEALASVNGVLFAVGWFDVDRDEGAGVQQAVAWLDGDLASGVWRQLQGGVDDIATAVHATPDALYVGGPFASTAAGPSVGIARFVFEEAP
ncbi:MAG: hypothetical protein KF901_20700 [Myxococcales bacterium]|nr:hypothetical protein [Myxococcales bacterium]